MDKTEDQITIDALNLKVQELQDQLQDSKADERYIRGKYDEIVGKKKDMENTYAIQEQRKENEIDWLRRTIEMLTMSPEKFEEAQKIKYGAHSMDGRGRW